MISLKKYLEMDPERARGAKAEAPKTGADDLLSVTLESYRSALVAMGKSGVQACPSVGSSLQQNLATLESRLADKVTPEVVKKTDKQVTEQLQKWGECAANYCKAKTHEVKELLITLARTADSVGERDQRYTEHFNHFTDRLQAISTLDDLTQVRASLVQGAAELKTYVDKMEQDSHKLVAHLQEEVSTFETRLKKVEDLALRDPLTGLPNRRNVEERIEWRIEHQQTFCVVMMDLNRLKRINDEYGHLAGDCLLQQFAHELKSNSRSTDLAGRWGGDEFILVMDCDLAGATTQLERMQRWVFGEYTIRSGENSPEVKVTVDAAVGTAQWKVGETLQDVVQHADAAMYRNKAKARGQGA